MWRTKTTHTHFSNTSSRRSRSGLWRVWWGHRRALAVVGLIWLLTLAPLPWPVTPVMGATITVNDPSGGTGGPGCKLRDAITAANTDTATGGCPAGSGADTIVLPSNATITLTTTDNTTDGANGLPSITTTITIQGNGATIQRSTAVTCDLVGDTDTGEFRIFHVAGTGNLTLQNVTVKNGCADGAAFPDNAGGGIFVASGGTLTVTTSTISSNSADGEGGGIFNFVFGTVTIANSTISGNSADFGGGIVNFSTVTLTNSTISGNSADLHGGGIDNHSTVTITNSTISGNSSGGDPGEDGGGIWNNDTVNASFVTIANNSAGASGLGGGIFNDEEATVNIKNSIVGDNTAGGGGPNCSSTGTFNAVPTNLDTDGSCAALDGDFTQVPSAGAGGLNLGPLQVNAPGVTATHALLAGSAAVDFAADCAFLPTPGGPASFDQRGVVRPQGSVCDVGAYEARGGAVSMDGGGHCLIVDTDSGTYQLIRSAVQVVTGQLVSRLRGSVLSFQNQRGEPRVLKGTINFTSARGSAAMVFPLSLGGGRAIIRDLDITMNPTCP